MPTTLPVTFRASPLPSNFRGTPQQFLDAIVARLSIEGQTNLSFFVSGAVAPTSDQGPWLKNGVTWYVWDVNTGAYIPEILEPLSLRYIVSQNAPPPASYTFWIRTNPAGTAIGISTYDPVTLAWRDVYEDRFVGLVTPAAMATAITAGTNQLPFRAHKDGSNQIYTAGDPATRITFEAEDFDVGNAFTAASTFVAPATGYYEIKASAYVTLGTGTPTGIDRQIKLRVNGIALTRKNVQVSNDTGGATIDISDTFHLTAADVVDVVIDVVSTGASTWSILADSTNTFFTGHRVLAP